MQYENNVQLKIVPTQTTNTIARLVILVDEHEKAPLIQIVYPVYQDHLCSHMMATQASVYQHVQNFTTEMLVLMHVSNDTGLA